MTDMMAGQVHLIFESMSSISPHHRAGGCVASRYRARPLAELPRHPDHRRIGPAGLRRDGVGRAHHAAGVSKAVIAKLNDAVNQAMTSPTLLEKYAANGVEAVGGTPEAFGALIKREVEKYAALAKTLKAKVD